MHNTMLPSDLARRVATDDDVFVLDVRNESDYEEWHIPGSHNVPVYDQLVGGNTVGLDASLDELPADEEIAVVCVAGVTSTRAAAHLRENGYDAVSVEGGMNGWGRVHRQYAVDGVDGVVQFVRPGTGCVSYLVHANGEAVVVDPSQYLDQYLTAAAERDLDVVAVADTHAHADHVSGGRFLANELDVPYYIHADDAGSLSGAATLTDGDALAVGGRALSVLATPGHTPGSVSFRFGDALLSGDTLFLRSVGRPDLEDGAEDAVRAAASDLFDSLDRLSDLPEDLTVLPGHFSDERMRPLATSLGSLQSASANELLGYVEADDEATFVETIVESLSDEPANYNRIKRINWGEERPTGNTAALELGPNNCAAN